MSKREHRIYFSSADSQENSTKGYFIVNLPLSLDLSGDWKCSILNIYLSSKSINNINSIFILGDFCETSLINENKQLPVLNKVYLKKRENFYSFNHPLYIPLKQKHISSFELEFLDSDCKRIDFGKDFLIECTLHFYRDE